MKVFFSHAGEFKGRVVKPKLLRDHTSGVTTKALGQLSPAADFGIAWENLHDQMQQIGKYHDLGKYTPYFQDYLFKRPGWQSGERGKLKQHAKFGAFVLFEKNRQISGSSDNALLAFFIILHHHLDLSDFDDIKIFAQDSDEPDARIFQKQQQSLLEALPQIANEMDEPLLSRWLTFPSKNEFRNLFRQFYPQLVGIRHYFQINYLFSLLIEADKLDASDTISYSRKYLDSRAVERRIESFKKLPGFKPHPLRDRVRQEVIARLDDSNFLDKRLFTLTAPTGVGKTLTALDFALKLRERVPSLQRGQVIYALPFINIIEQSLTEYQEVFKDQNCKVLAHYQYADVFGEAKRQNGDNFGDSEQDYHQNAMSLDTWQADVVITSFVQLLHTLIGNRNKLLKKFNHFADSILILDEVQTLRLDLLPIVGAALFYLTRFMNTRVLLMTATKPEIMPLAFKKLLDKEGVPEALCKAEELLPGFEDIFTEYKRTQIIPLIDIELGGEDAEQLFLESIFSKNWESSQSCLIVVNKVQRCIDLFCALKAHLAENALNNPIYCLSTNIVPLHRQGRITQIKADLEAGLKPVLIATQVVEAGVDLDFDMGFRDLGPIDSIVQVAGRINRQSDPVAPAVLHKPLFVMDFGDCKKIYGKTTNDAVRAALQGKHTIKEGEYLTLVSAYFSDISDQGYDKSISIFKAMKELRYNKLDEDFQVIEDRPNTVSVFVICDPVPESEDVLAAFRSWQDCNDKEMTKEKFEEQFKKAFHQRIIAVPKYYTEHLDDLAKDIKLAFSHHYDYETGLLRGEVSVPKDRIHTLSL